MLIAGADRPAVPRAARDRRRSGRGSGGSRSSPAVACAGPLSPVIYGLGQGIVDGQFVSPPVFWRSSPRGVDLLAYRRTPIPITRSRAGCWVTARPRRRSCSSSTPPRSVCVAIGIVIAGSRWARFRPKPGWWWLTCGFMALSLGPFVIVGGVNTHVPGPVGPAPLRAGHQRRPNADAVCHRRRARPRHADGGRPGGARRTLAQRRRMLGCAACSCCCCASWCLAPRTLYSAEYSPLVADHRRRTRGRSRVLNLPFGVRDGRSSAGRLQRSVPVRADPSSASHSSAGTCRAVSSGGWPG